MLYKKILFLLLAFFFAAQSASADVPNKEADGWSYAFHLEYSNNTIAPDKSSGELYMPIPEVYTTPLDPTTSDYYGVILSGKGKELGRFGFNTPETTVVVLGKSIFDVRAPFFANADHVNFYSKNKKLLFTISVKGSSFCNDNNSCNADVGENYMNCPNDCPPPPPTQPVTTTPESSTNPSTVVNPPTTPIETVGATTTETPSITTTETPIQIPLKTTITLIVLGVIFLILIFVLWKLRGFTEE